MLLITFIEQVKKNRNIWLLNVADVLLIIIYAKSYTDERIMDFIIILFWHH